MFTLENPTEKKKLDQNTSCRDTLLFRRQMARVSKLSIVYREIYWYTAI